VIPNPDSDFILHAGDVLVVFGRRDQISAFDAECGQAIV
jgi:K+/H+ antiporter YhaU regulatory subunit KhtT